MGYLDHVVVAVADLDSAAAGWCQAGLPANPGGDHPVGTFNALVRGPESAYVELIAARPDADHPSAVRVREHPGPLSWAIGVDSIQTARDLLQEAGFPVGEVVAGARTTPQGQTLGWSLLDVGDHPYHAHLPFLIEWHHGMPAAAAGPVLRGLVAQVPEPDRTASVLEAAGLTRTGSTSFTDGRVQIEVEPGERGPVELWLGGTGETGDVRLDGVTVRRES